MSEFASHVGVDFARLVRADNPSPMTLEGTNTWLVRDGDAWVVIDPGPMLDQHLDSLESATDGRVSRVLLTHGHPDHAEGAALFASRVKAPLFAARADVGVEPFERDQEIGLASGSLTVLPTPGHTGDSTTFVARVGDQAALFTGDTVLGRGTTVLMPPDGTLGDYLESLERLEWIAAELHHQGLAMALLPGHGPAHPDALPVIAYYLDHRQERLEQIRMHLREGITDPHELVARIYADVPEAVKAAALLSLQAQLEYLSDRA